MPEKMTTPPGEKMATRAEYETLCDDHPKKFSAEQVHFERGADKPERGDGRCCSGCFHYYRGMFHNVCEIFRPTDGYPSIDPIDYCHFWTQNGEVFPLLKE